MPRTTPDQAWTQGRDAGLADHLRWKAWTASGRTYRYSPTQCPYDTPAVYMSWIDGYTAGTKDAAKADALATRVRRVA